MGHPHYGEVRKNKGWATRPRRAMGERTYQKNQETSRLSSILSSRFRRASKSPITTRSPVRWRPRSRVTRSLVIQVVDRTGGSGFHFPCKKVNKKLTRAASQWLTCL